MPFARATDWASLTALTIAKAKQTAGLAMKDNIRKISQGGGEKVYSAVEGLKLTLKLHFDLLCQGQGGRN